MCVSSLRHSPHALILWLGRSRSHMQHLCIDYHWLSLCVATKFGEGLKNDAERVPSLERGNGCHVARLRSRWIKEGWCEWVIIGDCWVIISVSSCLHCFHTPGLVQQARLSLGTETLPDSFPGKKSREIGRNWHQNRHKTSNLRDVPTSIAKLLRMFAVWVLLYNASLNARLSHTY